jgi:hypothetical protein
MIWLLELGAAISSKLGRQTLICNNFGVTLEGVVEIRVKKTCMPIETRGIIGAACLYCELVLCTTSSSSGDKLEEAVAYAAVDKNCVSFGERES